jgi:hypothetical protein
MNSKPSARSIVILVAGPVVFFAGPSLAATAAGGSNADTGSQHATAAPVALHKNFKHGLRHGKTYAHRKFHRVALNPTSDKNDPAAEVVAEAGKALPDFKALPDIPPSVANANAQVPSPGMLDENARLTSAHASDLLQASSDSQADTRADDQTIVIAADQLNDVDRSLREGSPPPASSANPPPEPVTAAARESSTWDRTSLIGKIFIGFGALLTMASAARMFMA